MTKFDEMIAYLSGKGVQMVVKTEYVDGKPAGRKLMTKLTVTKKDQFFRVNGKIVAASMAKELMRMA